MGAFDNEAECVLQIKQWQESWNTATFEAKEIYFLTRIGKEPYYVRKVIPLAGQKNSIPYFTPISE